MELQEVVVWRKRAQAHILVVSPSSIVMTEVIKNNVGALAALIELEAKI